MKHRHGNRILSRTAEQRKHLLQNLASALFTHGSIVTSEAKAKELRRFVEPLITDAKKELTVHRRRELLRKLGSPSDLTGLQKAAQQNSTRPGGYLRLTKLPVRRSDSAHEVRIDILGGASPQ